MTKNERKNMAEDFLDILDALAESSSTKVDAATAYTAAAHLLGSREIAEGLHHVAYELSPEQRNAMPIDTSCATCGGPLAVGPKMPEVINLPKDMTKAIEYWTPVIKKAVDEGRDLTGHGSDEVGPLLRVFINPSDDSSPHQCLWAYRISANTAKLINTPMGDAYSYGDVVRLSDFNPDKLPLVLGLAAGGEATG